MFHTDIKSLWERLDQFQRLASQVESQIDEKIKGFITLLVQNNLTALIVQRDGGKDRSVSEWPKPDDVNWLGWDYEIEGDFDPDSFHIVGRDDKYSDDPTIVHLRNIPAAALDSSESFIEFIPEFQRRIEKRKEEVLEAKKAEKAREIEQLKKQLEQMEKE